MSGGWVMWLSMYNPIQFNQAPPVEQEEEDEDEDDVGPTGSCLE